MDPDRWREIERLYHAALEHDPAARDAYLRDACRDDPDLLREVEELLAYQERAGGFIETPAIDIAARQEAAALATGARFRLATGARLGPYEILNPLGAGGMGEVYRARDTRLSRDVAVKVLPAEVANDPSRRHRFEIEARAVAALNHPNIVALYDVGEGYLVSELVDGKPLQSAKLALPKLLNVAVQIANGLAAAHAAGITHRDLKPGNILLTRDGRAKILDFGLAKMTQPRAGAAATETVTVQTEPGIVMGTVGYMSSEQVRNQEVDGRSDIFSLGVILHELLSGARPFRGETSTDVMHAILREDPPELPASVPAAVKQIVAHCLEKDPNNRFQSAKDLAFALEASTGSAPQPVTPKRRALPKWAIPAALVVAAGALLVWLTRPLPAPRVTGMVQITRDTMAKHIGPLVSDGSRLFFWPDYQVSAEGGESVARTLQSGEGAYVLDVAPDGNELLVCRDVNTGCEIWVEPVLGGAPRRLGNLTADNDSANWSPDGQRVAYVRKGALRLATNDGTEIGKLAALDGHLAYPHWSPDGRKIRFTVSTVQPRSTRLWEVRPDGANLHPVLPEWNPAWSMCCGSWTPDGEYYVFEANQRLWAVREKAGLFRSAGPPVELNTGLLTLPDFDWGSLTVPDLLPGRDGKHLFFDGRQERNEFLRYDLKSHRFSLDFVGISGSGLELSKDGKWITYVSVPEGLLFRSAPDGSRRLQLTTAPMQVSLAYGSPDGTKIAFFGAPAGERPRIWVVPSDGGTARQVSNGEGSRYGDWDPTWSPDGASLAFGASSEEEAAHVSIHVVDLRTNRISTLPGSEGMVGPRWSPDGRLIAGLAGADHKLTLYDIQTHKQTQVFDQWSGYPHWSQDGEFLYFSTGEAWWRVRMRDRKVEPVANLKDFPVANWGWFGVAPDNTLITARSIGTDQIYALDLDLP